MELSSKGLDLIIEFEGYLKAQPDGSCKAYRCPAGVWTCGWGCTEGVDADTHWTKDEARDAFKRELVKHEKIVSRLVTVDLTQGQFDALVSFSYNCGSLGKSTLLKKLNASNYDGAADEFRYWNKARDPRTGKLVVLRGLVRRRKAESALFVSDMAGSDEMPQDAIEKRPVGLVVKENKELIAVAAAVVGGGGTAATREPTPPTVADNLAKGKEIKEQVEVAKDLSTYAHGMVKWSAGDGFYPVVMIAVAAVVLLLGPKIRERFS